MKKINNQKEFLVIALLVAALNLGYFFVEFYIANTIHSVSLFADSIDFLEDSALYLLAAVGILLSTKFRAYLGYMLSITLLIPSIFTLMTGYTQFYERLLPDYSLLTMTALGALVVNIICALMLTRYRESNESVVLAAYMSARNDAFANIGIIGAGIATFYSPFWIYDFIVGAGILLLNLDAFWKVFQRAQFQSKEHHEH
ncbi:MAG: cation transporter [Sulfuricurvum sp.]|nr:cation transporter [Sulfuricurvum sp.]MDD2949186.1 cation transporter [Sulfuricurvum sp.]